MVETKKAEVLNRQPLVIGMIGCLASGKTTLVAELGQRWGITPVEEKYPENPFLAKFYEEPGEYSYKSQTFFLLSKVKQLKEIDRTKVNLIDPSLTMDYLYAKTHNKMGWMNDNEWNLYQSLFYTLTEENQIVYPDIHIVVTADQKDLEKRIVQRDRPYEMWILKNYPEYLTKLSESVMEWASDNREKSYKFIANTTGEDLKGSVETLANRIEAHICAQFGTKNGFVLPNIKPAEIHKIADTFPGGVPNY